MAIDLTKSSVQGSISMFLRHSGISGVSGSIRGSWPNCTWLCLNCKVTPPDSLITVPPLGAPSSSWVQQASRRKTALGRPRADRRGPDPKTCNPSVNSRPDFLRISHLPPGCTMPGGRGCGLPSSPHPSARCARLHFGQMPPLPRSRFRAHAITTRHTQIPKAVHQQVVLLHYLATFVAAIQPVLPEEILQRPEHPQSA